jgi:hypothetical protein
VRKSTRLSLSSRQYKQTIEWHLSKPLLLDSLDLDDDPILYDHAHFTVSDAFNGRLNVIQIEVAGGRFTDARTLIRS